MTGNDSIDWDKDEDLVVPAQRPIRVYENSLGCVVICQEAFVQDDEDPFIVIRPENVPSVIAALTRLINAKPTAAT